MSQNESKMISEREAVLRERMAVEIALKELHKRGGDRWLAALPFNWEGSTKFAAALFPLPKVTRPRVAEDPHSGFTQVWRAVNGVIQWSDAGPKFKVDWRDLEPRGFPTDGLFDIRHLTPQRIKLWADLLANPTEEVDADA